MLSHLEKDSSPVQNGDGRGIFYLVQQSHPHVRQRPPLLLFVIVVFDRGCLRDEHI